MEQLELALSLNDINVDLSQFYNCDNKDEFYSSSIFKNLINKYYGLLEPLEKYKMIEELSYSADKWNGSRWLRI